MNCKQGDLVYFTGLVSDSNVGKVMHCIAQASLEGLARALRHPGFIHLKQGYALWYVDALIDWHWIEDGQCITFKAPIAPDSCLRPIRGDLLADENEIATHTGAERSEA